MHPSGHRRRGHQDLDHRARAGRAVQQRHEPEVLGRHRQPDGHARGHVQHAQRGGSLRRSVRGAALAPDQRHLRRVPDGERPQAAGRRGAARRDPGRGQLGDRREHGAFAVEPGRVAGRLRRAAARPDHAVRAAAAGRHAPAAVTRRRPRVCARAAEPGPPRLLRAHPYAAADGAAGAGADRSAPPDRHALRQAHHRVPRRRLQRRGRKLQPSQAHLSRHRRRQDVLVHARRLQCRQRAARAQETRHRARGRARHLQGDLGLRRSAPSAQRRSAPPGHPAQLLRLGMGLPVRRPARTARRAGARGQRALRRPARGTAAGPHRQLRAADGRCRTA